MVVNAYGRVTEDEKEQARQDAIERLRQEEMAKLRKPIQPKKATEKKPQDVQPSLLTFNTALLWKPKTKIQKEVAKLSATLPKLTRLKQNGHIRMVWNISPIAPRKGNITCPDCGHEWHSDDSTISDTLFRLPLSALRSGTQSRGNTQAHLLSEFHISVILLHAEVINYIGGYG